MDKVYLDIETIPSQLDWVREYAKEKTTPPGTIKKAESIEKWYAESYGEAVEETIGKMGFSGASNHIISIGVALNDEPAISFDVRDLDKEEANLRDFFKFLPNHAVYVGHNIAGFDLRVIRQRAITLGVPLHRGVPWFAKPWENNPFDTMVQWDSKNFTKLDILARAFGVGGKGGMDGSKVYGAWQEGRIDEIAQYCREDVEMTRAVYKHMAQEQAS